MAKVVIAFIALLFTIKGSDAAYSPRRVAVNSQQVVDAHNEARKKLQRGNVPNYPEPYEQYPLVS